MEGRDPPLKFHALGDHSAVHYYRLIEYAEETGDREELEKQAPEPYSGLWSLCKKKGVAAITWHGLGYFLGGPRVDGLAQRLSRDKIQ
jgi:hypothetical protein